MRKALWLSFFCLWPVAALAAENTSVYTPFDLEKTCTQVREGRRHGVRRHLEMPGLQGQRHRRLGRRRPELSWASARSRPKPAPSRKTFGRFNTALSPVEWRLENGKPIAAIQRWRVVTDDDGNTVDLAGRHASSTGAEACPVHYIAGSYPNANEHARAGRRCARREDFDCEHDVPTVDSKVGADGIDFVSCAEVKCSVPTALKPCPGRARA